MSAPGTHGTGDIWPGILDEFRCEAVDEGRRCQLYVHRTGPHAHAVPPPTANLPVHRWYDGERWTEQPGYGMRWCCMFAE